MKELIQEPFAYDDKTDIESDDSTIIFLDVEGNKHQYEIGNLLYFAEYNFVGHGYFVRFENSLVISISKKLLKYFSNRIDGESGYLKVVDDEDGVYTTICIDPNYHMERAIDALRVYGEDYGQGLLYQSEVHKK